jgi:hypothetical protein
MVRTVDKDIWLLKWSWTKPLNVWNGMSGNGLSLEVANATGKNPSMTTHINQVSIL